MFSSNILLLISCCCIIILSGCASEEKDINTVERGSILERIPIVYRQDIQQGNVVTQENINQLRIGLSKRQVRFIMGTPMLVDMFHQSRWDYVYTITRGWGKMERRRIRLYFDKDKLQKIQGDMIPQPGGATQVKRETVVKVPDYVDPNRGVIKQAVEYISDAFTSKPKPQSQQLTPTP